MLAGAAWRVWKVCKRDAESCQYFNNCPVTQVHNDSTS